MALEPAIPSLPDHCPAKKNSSPPKLVARGEHRESLLQNPSLSGVPVDPARVKPITSSNASNSFVGAKFGRSVRPANPITFVEWLPPLAERRYPRLATSLQNPSLRRMAPTRSQNTPKISKTYATLCERLRIPRSLAVDLAAISRVAHQQHYAARGAARSNGSDPQRLASSSPQPQAWR